MAKIVKIQPRFDVIVIINDVQWISILVLRIRRFFINALFGCKGLKMIKVHDAMSNYTVAIQSISTIAPFGKCGDSTVARAGGLSLKNSEYASLNSIKF